MKQERNVRLSFGSWVYLGGLMGLSGGVVIGLLSAVWAALHGQWIEAFTSVVVAPLCGLLSFAVYAALGFAVYMRISSAFPNSRLLSGEFSAGAENAAHS
jgi:hypothetical protein